LKPWARAHLTDGHAPLTIDGGPLHRHRLHHAHSQRPGQNLHPALPACKPPEPPPSAKPSAPATTANWPSAPSAPRSPHPDSISIAGPQSLHAIDAAVPGDISSAAFFLCAAALFPGSSLVLDSLGLNPTRATLLDVLTALGARTSASQSRRKNAELVGTVQVTAPPEGLGSTEVSGALAAQLIDELPVLAAIAPLHQRRHPHPRRQELRVKESDRIALVAKNLRAMGAEVEEFEDGLDVPGGQTLHGATIDSGGDHRIAMAFSVAALAPKATR
jgi:3-phosphoshikimate 1-carboxyvinyltransferase